MKKCPQCGGENADQATFCIQCGKNLVATTEAQHRLSSVIGISVLIGGVAGFVSTLLVNIFFLILYGYWGYFGILGGMLFRCLIVGILGGLIGLVFGLVLNNSYRLTKTG